MSSPSIFTVLATLAVCLSLLALLLAVLVVAYRHSLTRHPYTDCRRCKSTGRRRSRIFAHSIGYCPDCTGTGLKVRLGVYLLNTHVPALRTASTDMNLLDVNEDDPEDCAACVTAHELWPRWPHGACPFHHGVNHGLYLASKGEH